MANKVYIVAFWLDSAQVVTHRFASLDKADTISAARDYIVRLKINDSGWENFLLAGMSEWDGDAIQVDTVGPGKLVLFSAPLGVGDLRLI